MATPHPFEDLDAPSLIDARERHHSTGANAETHIFQSVASLARGYREVAERATDLLRHENTWLLTRIENIRLLVLMAQDGVNQGRLSEAREYLALADQLTRMPKTTRGG